MAAPRRWGRARSTCLFWPSDRPSSTGDADGPGLARSRRTRRTTWQQVGALRKLLGEASSRPSQAQLPLSRASRQSGTAQAPWRCRRPAHATNLVELPALLGRTDELPRSRAGGPPPARQRGRRRRRWRVTADASAGDTSRRLPMVSAGSSSAGGGCRGAARRSGTALGIEAVQAHDGCISECSAAADPAACSGQRRAPARKAASCQALHDAAPLRFCDEPGSAGP
jgi:hypothetical protein